MTAAAAEPMLQTELWVSFVSMLRSYAAARSLHAGEIGVAVTEYAVTIAAGASQLDMQFDPDSSQVIWSRRTASHAPIAGSFSLDPEGRVSIDGAAKDLDHAAIDFIASITEGAKGGAR